MLVFSVSCNGQGAVEWRRPISIMQLSGISGHGTDSIVVQWGSTIKSPECALTQVGIRPDIAFYVARM